MNSYDNEGSVNPTLTANTIVNNLNQSSSSEEQITTNLRSGAIKVEKQGSSSEGQEEVEQEDEENDSDDEEFEFPVALNGLVFSFLPQEVADRLNHQPDWKKRVSAIQETETLIKKQFSRPNEDFPIYITDICKKMCKMMHDNNFKISLTSLRIIHNL